MSLSRAEFHEQNLQGARAKAVELFASLVQERASTGRIYIHNVDLCNDHGPFDPAKAPIRQSNLCMEIALPTAPLTSNPAEGEIALCTLAAFNLGASAKPKSLAVSLQLVRLATSIRA